MGMPIGEWPGPCPAFQIDQDYKIGQRHQDKSQNSWDGDCGHPEGNIATMADDLCAGLDELLLEGRQRPVLDRLRRCQGSQELAEVIAKRLA